MGEMIIGVIPDAVLEAFEARARREGLTAEALARNLLVRESGTVSAGTMSYEEALARLDELRAMTPRPGGCSVPLLRTLRDGGYNDV